MSGWRGMFTGALALIALEAIVSSTGGAGRVGSALSSVADMVQRLLSPAVPLVPDRRGSASTSPGNVTQLRPPADTGRPWLRDYQPHRPRTPRPVNG